jgi:hypothetical protein
MGLLSGVYGFLQADIVASAKAARIGPSNGTRPAAPMPGLTSWDPLPETLIRKVASCLCMKECFQAIKISKSWHAAINR